MRWQLGREQITISSVIRTLGFTNVERKRLIDRVNKTVDSMRGLDKQAANFDKRAEETRSDDQKKEYRNRPARFAPTWSAWSTTRAPALPN